MPTAVERGEKEDILSDLLSYSIFGILTILLGCIVFWRPVIAAPLINGSLTLHLLYFILIPGAPPFLKYVEAVDLGIFLVLIFMRKSLFLQRVDRARLPGALPVGIILLALYTGVRASVVEDQYVAWFGFAIICGYIPMFFVVAWGLAKSSQVSRIGWFLLILNTFIALLGCGQFLWGWEFSDVLVAPIAVDFKRITVTFSGPDTLGIVMAAVLGIALSVFIGARRTGVRRVLAVLMFFLTVALVLSFSRSAWGAALVSMSVVLVSWRRRLTSHLMAAAVVLLGFAAAFVYLVPFEVFTGRFLGALDYAQQMDRIALWKLGWTRAMASPGTLLFGYGPGTVGSASIIVFMARNNFRVSQMTGYSALGYYLETESWALDLLNQVGLVGLVLYIFVLYSALRHWRRRAPQVSPELQPWLKGFNAALMGIVAGNVFLPSLSAWSVAALFWTLLGLLYVGCLMGTKPAGITYSSTSSRLRQRVGVRSAPQSIQGAALEKGE